MGEKDRGKGGARKGERRPHGPERAPGGRRKGRMTGGGAEVWESKSGRRRGIGNRPEEKAHDIRGGVGRGQEREPDVDEIVERERGPGPREKEIEPDEARTGSGLEPGSEEDREAETGHA